MDDLVERLRNTPNWMRESYGSWKDCVLKYDRAPFEAADKIERLCSHVLAGLQREAAFAEQAEKQDDEIERLRAQLAERDIDAERWRKVPAFLEDYQIDYVNLLRDIDAAIRTPPAVKEG